MVSGAVFKIPNTTAATPIATATAVKIRFLIMRPPVRIITIDYLANTEVSRHTLNKRIGRSGKGSDVGNWKQKWLLGLDSNQQPSG